MRLEHRIDRLFDRVDALQRVVKYNPDQSRDERGRWAAEGGGGGSASAGSRRPDMLDRIASGVEAKRVMERNSYVRFGRDMFFLETKSRSMLRHWDRLSKELEAHGYEIASSSGKPSKHVASDLPEQLRNKTGVVVAIRERRG